ncbi:UBX domain-containing protein 6 isoform X1 [Nothobranchius furzeri]|uniref:UBX domain-containing protein 6 n=1 Tax=Nothobranchius furzeri TaxID=105023 RepID=A0A1A7ZAU2_NOTFU|nr:UBX domain-containing protein 6 isoform X1 [Nothobranchius furzeri]KAF7203241.1 transcript variant X1 [Nothobranchius furzeri]
MKKFFDDIKKDMKFKSAGPGKKLTEDTSSRPEVVQSSSSAKQNRHHAPSEGAQRAGAAALARIEQKQRPKVHTSQDAIRNQVKRELEAEAAAVAEKAKAASAEGSGVPVKDFACLSVSGVYFTCPLTGATLTKSQREVHLKEAIFMRFEEDAVEASVMMIHTFNKDRDKVKTAVDIISKYVENICKNPTEEKYRKIKVSNKVFQEKVLPVEGSREFLQALGFISVMLPVEGQEEDEEFLVLPEQSPDALELMKERRDRLQKGQPVRAQLDRQPQAFRPSPNAQKFELPSEFYNLTAEELKREQQLRSELVEKNSMLRTKAMREKEEQRERRKYNYTLLRVRLPDGNLLQGTFYAWDRVHALFEFVRESLVDGWQPFELVAPGGQKLQESEEVSLVECNLVPAALLTFNWDAVVQADIAAAGGKSPTLLKPELLETIQMLS